MERQPKVAYKSVVLVSGAILCSFLMANVSGYNVWTQKDAKVRERRQELIKRISKIIVSLLFVASTLLL